MDYSVQTIGIMYLSVPVADPGFPVSGGAPSHLGGGGTNLQNGNILVKTCNNEKIGSHWGGRAGIAPLGPANEYMPGMFQCMFQTPFNALFRMVFESCQMFAQVTFADSMVKIMHFITLHTQALGYTSDIVSAVCDVLSKLRKYKKNIWYRLCIR